MQHKSETQKSWSGTSNSGPLAHQLQQVRGSFATFTDPDGNGWLLQEITTRLPGRVAGEAAYSSAGDTCPRRFRARPTPTVSTSSGRWRVRRELAGVVRGVHARLALGSVLPQ